MLNKSSKMFVRQGEDWGKCVSLETFESLRSIFIALFAAGLDL